MTAKGLLGKRRFNCKQEIDLRRASILHRGMGATDYRGWGVGRGIKALYGRATKPSVLPSLLCSFRLYNCLKGNWSYTWSLQTL